MSTGSICLIGQTSQFIYISNCYVMGIYQSSTSVALGAMMCKNSNFTVINYTFSPDIFIIGNASSYLFSFINCSIVEIIGAAVLHSIYANNTQPIQLTQISTTDSIFFQYGGICATLMNSIILIKQYIHDMQQSISTQFIRNSGSIIGQSFSTYTQISIESVCAQQLIQSSASIKQVGVIGNIEGNISLLNSAISQNVSFGILFRFGIVGLLNQNVEPNISTFINVIISTIGIQSTATISNSFDISMLIGRVDQNTIFNNTSVVNGFLNGYGQIGGFIGYAGNGTYRYLNNCIVSNNSILGPQNCGGINGYSGSVVNITVQNSNLSNSTIGQLGKYYIGGLMGQIVQTSIYISNVKMLNIYIVGSSQVAFLVGSYNGGSFTISGSSSSGSNYVNSKLQPNCKVLNVSNSQSGC
ncbi:Hypothetical_protein [Hexamita inflata]|uniref:Hypothetical_protein n=1 Tax=Hexamita inflata TaxID=28002 RepID=A0AA86R053_9EUKA|nr:Hypothetical protein HINF_LOCUS54801 [Hexamita inflata]CAI9967163.1 Hypothetical protein HINF_LOCUS54808 [Hexamita inflata]